MTRSVLASELFGAVHPFDFASTIKTTLDDISGKRIPLVLLTDSKSLYDERVGINTMTKKRLLIDLRMHFEPYELHELANIVWVSSAQNPADVRNTDNTSPTLCKLKKLKNES